MLHCSKIIAVWCHYEDVIFDIGCVSQLNTSIAFVNLFLFNMRTVSVTCYTLTVHALVGLINKTVVRSDD